MNPVPFDHKAHEEYNDTCRVCHHADLDSCSRKCHTLAGTSEGRDVKLERAMHQMGTKKSCLGCHETSQRDMKCAGCHAFMEKGRKQKESFCLTCHIRPLQEGPEIPEKPEVTADLLLQSRKAITYTYKDEDIPENDPVDRRGDRQHERDRHTEPVGRLYILRYGDEGAHAQEVGQKDIAGEDRGE